MKNLIVPFLFFLFTAMNAQTNIVVTNPEADAILKGNYNPEEYMPTNVINKPAEILQGINNDASASSLHDYIVELVSFENRNTGSDTISSERGIGAARRKVYQMFQEFSMKNNNRLIPFYLQFDQSICGMSQHRNIAAVLPGNNVANHSIIIVEGHIDSRCETGCDTQCDAHGAEDNASGTALVIELARIMSQYSYNQTIVFVCTIGEEQGLFGANAFAKYCKDNNINVKAVFNNDVVGGIYCGSSSSPPPCPFEGHIDSTQLRMFAQSGDSRQLSRFVKLEYEEELKEKVSVPMDLSIMSVEDRTGRGGDHIPFRMKGYASMRFTSANENGSANSSDPQYDGHQHSARDILGVDTDGDNVIDSFFVDFNYLARNTVVNGMAASLAALGPQTPIFYGEEDGNKLIISIEDELDYNHYRIFSRSTEEDFDSIYDLVGSKSMSIERISNPTSLQKVSIASVDENGIESLFSREQAYFPFTTNVKEVVIDGVQSSQIAKITSIWPNPFNDFTTIGFLVMDQSIIKDLEILITDSFGRKIRSSNFKPLYGYNEIRFNRDNMSSGIYNLSLIINGYITESTMLVIGG